jgi:dolichol kinase
MEMLPDKTSLALMLLEGLLVPWLMLDRKHLSAFGARKLCHAGSGIIMMSLNCDNALCRFFIYLVALVSLTMNWELFPSLLPNFWFGVPRDKGITLYLILVSVWVFLGRPLAVLAPVFLADPAGAVVGKAMTLYLGRKKNPKWIGEKTVCGSAAVLVVTFLSLQRPDLRVALLATLGEAVGGAYDNLVIALVVILFSGYS